MAFVDNLRMAGIFGNNPPLGMPNMQANQGLNIDEISRLMGRVNSVIQSNKQDDRDWERKMYQERHTPSPVARIGAGMMGGQQAQGPQSQGPMRTVMGAGFSGNPIDNAQAKNPNLITAFQKATLAANQAKLAQAGETAEGRQNVAQQRADIYGNINDLSGSEKLGIQGQQRMNQIGATGANRLEQIGAQGDNAMEIQGLRGTQRMDQIGETGNQRIRQIGAQGQNQMNVQGLRGTQMTGQIEQRGNNATDLQRMRGDQAVTTAMERGNQSRLTNAAKPAKEMLPTQLTRQQNNNARELVTSRPDLAEFVDINPDNGTFTIMGDPNEATLAEIQGKIFGQGKDVNLPSRGSYTNTPGSDKPAKSKYKVVIE